MTPVIPPRRHPYLYSDGVTTTIPPTPLSTQIQVPYRLSSMAQKHIEQSMATTRCTSGWRGQKINACCIAALQDNCSHRIRRKTATPKATFCLSLSFSPFYRKCNPSPPLGNYKSGGRDTNGRGSREIWQSDRVHLTNTRTTLPKRSGIRSLSRKLVTPTTRTPV
jgi:hypothetical protein